MSNCFVTEQMPNVPHDIPVPHTLVLDLESTLVSSTWDRKYGWRHAKRPGVDKFLLDMAQYYEIVLYSPSIQGIAEPVVDSLDKQGCIMHRLFRDATYYTNGIHVKDLSRLNRNVSRIVVLDDDPAEVSFQPENLIRVKPYTDPTDRTDNTLARITPFLIEIARENYNDIPELLQQYEGMDADEIASEQDRRIDYYRTVRDVEMSKGLGGLAKMARRSVSIEPDMIPTNPSHQSTTTTTPQQLSSKDIVGAPPSSTSFSSTDESVGLVGFLNRREEEKAEATRRKFEKWNEVMLKKQRVREQQQQQG
jgi:import inner membrane translocase subunit TIM50